MITELPEAMKEQVRQLAARLWCDPLMSHCEMDSEACDLIADILEQVMVNTANDHEEILTNYIDHIGEINQNPGRVSVQEVKL